MKHSVATDLPVLITNLDGSTLEWFLNVLCRHFVYIPYTAASPFNHFCVDKPYSVSSGEADLVPAPVFVDQLHLRWWGHSNHLGIVLCSAYLAWSVTCQVHKEIDIGQERSYLYQVQLDVRVCTRLMHYILINPGCYRTQQTAILMFCNMLCSGGLFDPVHQHLLWS